MKLYFGVILQKGHSVTEEICEKYDEGKIRSKPVFRALEIMAVPSQ